MHTSRGRTVYPVSRAIPTHAPRQLANSLLADCIAPQTLAIFRMYFRLVGDNPRMSERPFLRSTIYGQACVLMTALVIAASIALTAPWADGRKAVPRTPTQRRAAIECLGGIGEVVKNDRSPSANIECATTYSRVAAPSAEATPGREDPHAEVGARAT